MKGILDFVLKMKFVPEGWLTVAGGFGGLLIGAGNLVCHYTAACSSTLSPEASLALVAGGAAAVGLGRRKTE